MLTQVLTYWNTNWPALLTGVVIGAIAIPVVKTAAKVVYDYVAKLAKRTASARHAAVRWFKRIRAARGRYVGPLSIADVQAVLAETPAERLHPVYQEQMRKAAQALANAANRVPWLGRRASGVPWLSRGR